MNKDLIMKFSVIIPAYNSQDFLKRAVDSVLCQTYSNYELIIVNDGSTDKTLSIAENFVQKNNNVRCINKENGGLSSARNAGIKAAKGEYLVFLDSDDKLHSKNLLYKISNYITKEKPDLIIGNIQAITKNNQRFFISSNLDLEIKSNASIQEIIRAYIKLNRQPPWLAFQSIINRNFLVENGLFFNEETPTQEDVLFFFQISQCVNSVELVKDIFVDYTFSRDGSITQSLNYANIMNALENFSYIYDRLAREKEVKKYIACRYADYVPAVFLLSGREKEQCIREIKNKKYILKDVNYKNKKYLFYKLMWKIFGLKYGCKIILTVKDVRNVYNSSN
jgi:glycosyltransferase involved in cell wall biosynthesis